MAEINSNFDFGLPTAEAGARNLVQETGLLPCPMAANYVRKPPSPRGMMSDRFRARFELLLLHRHGNFFMEAAKAAARHDMLLWSRIMDGNSNRRTQVLDVAHSLPGTLGRQPSGTDPYTQRVRHAYEAHERSAWRHRRSPDTNALGTRRLHSHGFLVAHTPGNTPV